MSRFFTRDRLLHSSVDSCFAILGVLTVSLLVRHGALTAGDLVRGLLTAAVVVVLRVFLRPERSTPPFRFPRLGSAR